MFFSTPYDTVTTLLLGATLVVLLAAAAERVCRSAGQIATVWRAAVVALLFLAACEVSGPARE